MKTLYESIVDLNPDSEIEDDVDIFDLILKSKNREEFNERLDMLESMGEEWPYPGDVLNKKDVYFFVVTNTMGKKDVFKHVRIGCNGKANSINLYDKKPFVSWEDWKVMLQDDEKLKLPEKLKKYYKKHFR